MRHNSQRVPGKNYRDFVGKELFRHVLDALLSSRNVDRVIIDTDSSVIRSICLLDYTADQVHLLERPEDLRAPETPMNKILLHDIGQVGGEYFLQTHSTNPLLKPETIESAVEMYFDGLDSGSSDSLFSVTSRRIRIWSAKGMPLNHDPGVLMQTQDLEPYFEENSCMYIFSSSSLTANGNRIGSRPMLFEMNPLEAIDIDEEQDFVLAEALYMYSKSQ